MPFSPSLLDPTLTYPLTQPVYSGTVGPFERGSAKYWVTTVVNSDTTTIQLVAYRSLDNGVTFDRTTPSFNTATGTNENAVSVYYPDNGGSLVYVGLQTKIDGHLHAITFDMAAPFDASAFTDNDSGVVAPEPYNFYQNQIVKLPNGNLVIFYGDIPSPGVINVSAIVWNTSSWSSPIAIGTDGTDFIDVAIVNGDGNACLLWDDSTEFWYTILVGTTPSARIDAGPIPSHFQTTGELEINCSFYDPHSDSFAFSFEHGHIGPGDTLSVLIGTPASAPVFSTVDVAVAGGGGEAWQSTAIATDGAGHYSLISWGLDAGQDVIHLFTATDLNGPWSGPSVYYNLETNPPSPPPTAHEIYPLYVRYMADGNLGVTFGALYQITPPPISWCGVLVYLPESGPPPPEGCPTIYVARQPQPDAPAPPPPPGM